jgi:hypothetical protein
MVNRGLFEKTTGLLTSVLGIAEALGQFVCPNRDASQPHPHHKHVELVDGKAASTAEYTQKLVYAVLHAFRRHLRENSTLATNDLEAGCHGHEEIDLALCENVVDESTGKTLPPTLVRKARQEEIEFLRRFPVYFLVPRSESEGMPFLQVRWVDLNKGDGENWAVCSRFVAKDFKFRDPCLQGLFAGTPPLEALRALFSHYMTIQRLDGVRLDVIMLFFDISRAHFHPYIQRKLFRKLPADDACEGYVGTLDRTMYGTREASSAFEMFFNEVAVALGLIGTGPGDEKHCKILNRLVSLGVSNGIRQLTYVVDPLHVDLLVRGMGFEKGWAKAVVTPAERKDANYNTEPLPQEVVTSFRSRAMKLKFIGADLPHLQFSANVSARGMSTLISGDLLVMKRAVRYLVGGPRTVQVFKEQERVTTLDADADSNWTLNPIDRKSISCLHLKEELTC